MLYRSNTSRVLWPEIFIATDSGTPDRRRFRIAVRRKSWKISPRYFQRHVTPHQHCGGSVLGASGGHSCLATSVFRWQTGHSQTIPPRNDLMQARIHSLRKLPSGRPLARVNTRPDLSVACRQSRSTTPASSGTIVDADQSYAQHCLVHISFRGCSGASYPL